jgi:hypothetical protein
MHWMIEGEWYNISNDDFASRFSFGATDAHCPMLHIHNPLDEDEMKFMYTLGQEGDAGNTNVLYTFYFILNRLFRMTVCLRDGDPTNILQFAKNFLANMRNGTPPLSMVDFVWEEIKGISLNPQKNCGFTPYLMFMIEGDVSRSFAKEGIHMPFRPNPTKKPLIPPAHASSPLRADPTPQQQPGEAE